MDLLYIVSAMIHWPYMMVVQLHLRWLENIVIQYRQPLHRPAMKFLFVFKQMLYLQSQDSKWNIMQQVTNTRISRWWLKINKCLHVKKNVPFFILNKPNRNNPAVASQHQGHLFWITCKRLKPWRKAGHLQSIQNSTPSVAGMRQCCIPMWTMGKLQ